MTLQTISIMDYIGTFAFAISGAYLAIRYELDIFGIFVCAFTTACGGGITRDVVMNVGVPRFFSSYTTIAIVIVATLLAIVTKSDRWNKLMLTADAIGLAVFAIDTGCAGWIPASTCHSLSLHRSSPLSAVVLSGISFSSGCPSYCAKRFMPPLHWLVP